MSIFDEDPFPKTFPMAKAPDPAAAAAAAPSSAEKPEKTASAGEAATYPRVDSKAPFCKPCQNPPG